MTTIKTTGELAGFKSGAVLTSAADVAKYFRAMAGELDYKVPGDLSDDDIAKIAASVTPTDDAEETESLILGAISQGAVPEDGPVDVSVQGETAITMRQLAAKVGADSAMTALLNRKIDGDEFGKYGSRDVYFALLRIVGEGDNAKLTTVLPLPGSTIDGANDTPQSNNPDIRYARKPTSKNPNAKARTSAIELFTASLPLAASAQQQIDDYKKKLDAKSIGEEEFARQEKKWEGRRNSVIGIARDAIRIAHQIEALENYAGAEFLWDTDVTYDKNRNKHVDYVTSAAPVIIQGQDPDTKKTATYYLKIREFLTLSTKDAMTPKEGVPGSIAALMATLKRERKTNPYKAVKDFDTFDGCATTYLAAMEGPVSVWPELVKGMEKRDDDAYHLFWTNEAIVKHLAELNDRHRPWAYEKKKAMEKQDNPKADNVAA